jgi:hypothetical protein
MVDIRIEEEVSGSVEKVLDRDVVFSPAADNGPGHVVDGNLQGLERFWDLLCQPGQPQLCNDG